MIPLDVRRQILALWEGNRLRCGWFVRSNFVPLTTPQGLSLRESTVGVEDSLDRLGAESGFGVFCELLAADEELLAVEAGDLFPVGLVVKMFE